MKIKRTMTVVAVLNVCCSVGGYKLYPGETLILEYFGRGVFAWTPIQGGPKYVMLMGENEVEVVSTQ